VKAFIEVSTAQVYDADKVPSPSSIFLFSRPSNPILSHPLQKASDESSKIKPWTLVAKSKLKAEEELKNIAGYGCPFFFFFHSFILFSHIAHLTCCSLNYVIVRPAIVYGTGDVLGISE